jgi:hypothetical protein
MKEINEECKGCLSLHYATECNISQKSYSCASSDSHCVCQKCLIKSICQELCQEFISESIINAKRQKETS